jgi:hypothetical protein
METVATIPTPAFLIAVAVLEAQVSPGSGSASQSCASYGILPALAHGEATAISGFEGSRFVASLPQESVPGAEQTHLPIVGLRVPGECGTTLVSTKKRDECQ